MSAVMEGWKFHNLSPVKVYGCTFYMGKFNGPTPKRHRLFSNDRNFLQPISDIAGYMSRLEQSQCKVKTARSYHDKQGVRRHVGNKETLRDSQKLCYNSKICFSLGQLGSFHKWSSFSQVMMGVLSQSFVQHMIQHLRTYTREFGQFVAKTIMERIRVSWLWKEINGDFWVQPSNHWEIEAPKTIELFKFRYMLREHESKPIIE